MELTVGVDPPYPVPFPHSLTAARIFSLGIGYVHCSLSHPMSYRPSARLCRFPPRLAVAAAFFRFLVGRAAHFRPFFFYRLGAPDRYFRSPPCGAASPIRLIPGTCVGKYASTLADASSFPFGLANLP